MFGGCLDASSFLSLTKTYVQTKELWLLDLASFTWLKVGCMVGAKRGAMAWLTCSGC